MAAKVELAGDQCGSRAIIGTRRVIPSAGGPHNSSVDSEGVRRTVASDTQDKADTCNDVSSAETPVRKVIMAETHQ